MTEGSGRAVSKASASGGGYTVPQGSGVALASATVTHVVNLTGRLEVTAPPDEPTVPVAGDRLVRVTRIITRSILRALEHGPDVLDQLSGLLGAVARHRPRTPRLITL